MFKKQILIDGKVFYKGHKLNAKRPTEYWLTFMKRFVLINKKPTIKYWLTSIERFVLTNKKQIKDFLNLRFTKPIILLILLSLILKIFNTFYAHIYVNIVIIILIVFFFKRIKKRLFPKQTFFPVEAFHDLAKFIISIKGDIHKFNMRLNCAPIEEKNNRIDPNDIGLKQKPRKKRAKHKPKVKYAPYQLERFKANFVFKDGSLCSVSLKQITVRVTSTKRRSSGKMKTKTKYKHKFFHVFTLKLNTKDYKVHNEGLKIMRTDRFDINVRTAHGFGYIEVIAKVKLSSVPSQLELVNEHKQSLYNEMVSYLLTNKVITTHKIRKT